MILLDAASQVLPPFGAKLGEKSKKALEDLGVEVQLGAMVTDVDERGLEVQDKNGTEAPHRVGHQDLGRRRAGQPAGRRRSPSSPAPRSTAPAASASTPT